MKKLGVLFVILSFVVIFNACPPLEEDDPDSIYSGSLITFDETFELDAYKWFEILDSIALGRKYVSLDLSKGTYKEDNTVGGLIKIPGSDDIIFDPFPAAASGKNFILSIILPNEAQIINQAVEGSKTVDKEGKIIDDEEKIEENKRFSAFRAFTNLRSVKADNVTLIGNFAFADCTKLREVVFPRVGHKFLDTELEDKDTIILDIGRYAFLGCTDIKEVKFNSTAVIGGYAFKDCTSLSKIDFPEVRIIERNAFEKCESLVNVFFEKASQIGDETFKGCTDLKKAEFNIKPIRLTNGNPIPLPVPFPLPSPPDNPAYDSVIFYPSVFNGCKALEVLDVRRAWNVYFSKDVLANTGSSVEIYLFDEPIDANTSFGHPQNVKFLGDGVTVTLKKVTISVPSNGELIQENSADDNIARFIRRNYNNIDVNFNRRSF